MGLGVATSLLTLFCSIFFCSLGAHGPPPGHPPLVVLPSLSSSADHPSAFINIEVGVSADSFADASFCKAEGVGLSGCMLVCNMTSQELQLLSDCDVGWCQSPKVQLPWCSSLPTAIQARGKTVHTRHCKHSASI